MSKPPKAPRDKGWDILSSMTQPNQSELIESILSILGIVDRTSGNRPEQIAVLEQELTAHINAEIARTLDRLEQDDAKLTERSN